MKLLKKLATLTLSATLFTATVLGAGTPQVAAQGTSGIINEKTMAYFPSDTKGHWAEKNISDFVNSDIIKGYQMTEADTGFPYVEVRPNNPITRAEFVAILVRAMNLTSTAPTKTFTDVKPGQWYSEPIRIASSLGIVSGVEDNAFAPTRNIKRDEIATLIVRAFEKTVKFDQGTPKSFTDVKNYWATPYINKASRVGIINGYAGGLFKPVSNATRAEAITMLRSALLKETSTPPDTKVLADFVAGWYDESMQILNTKNYSGLNELSNKYATGKEAALTSAAAETSPIPEAEDANVSITTHSRNATVTQQSDRLATVTLTADATVAIQSGTSNTTNRETMSLLVSLKKMPDGNWRIYGSDAPLEELNQ